MFISTVFVVGRTFELFAVLGIVLVCHHQTLKIVSNNHRLSIVTLLITELLTEKCALVDITFLCNRKYYSHRRQIHIRSRGLPIGCLALAINNLIEQVALTISSPKHNNKAS